MKCKYLKYIFFLCIKFNSLIYSKKNNSKIYREINEPNITSEQIADAKKCAKNFKQMIQIQIKDNSIQKESSNDYDSYVNDLVSKDLKQNNFKIKATPKRYNNLSYQQMLDDYRRKNLIRLEQKEYLDQITTITTTVKTFTKDDLFMLFDNNTNFYDNDLYDNELYSSSLDLNDLSELTCSLNKFKNTTLFEPNQIPNINKNVYSCLTNYITDYTVI